MATPTIAEERHYATGAKKGALWGTAVALGAGNGMRVLKDGDIGKARKQAYLPRKESDVVFIKGSDIGPIEQVDFSPECWARYDPGVLGTIMAMVFGTAGVPTIIPVFVVGGTNNKIDFDEGGAELVGTVASATYNTGAALAVAIAAAMNGAPGKALTYTCTYSSITRKFTIGAGANFTIRWNTGTDKLIDISTLCGYSDAADDTGAASYVSDTAAGGVTQMHTFQWADSIGGFVTFVSEYPNKIYEVASAKPHTLSFSIADGLIKIIPSLRGNTVIDNSAVNTAAQIDALTYVDDEHRIKFSQGKLWMNAQGGAALQASDAIVISDLNLDYKRGIEAPPHVAGQEYIPEPLESDWSEIALKLKFPRMNAANEGFFQAFTGETLYKALLEFEGAIITGAYTYKLSLYFPKLKVQVAPEYSKDGIVKGALEMVAEEPTAAPTGMTYARPYAELTNIATTDYLA